MKVGFIGLGGIGKPMAINIVKSGFDLTVADLREQPLQELRGHGAQVAHSPCEVAEGSDIVLASLPTNEASELVALGHDGILEGAAEGDIYVELSTISPTVVHNIADKTNEKGVHLLDAPVSGGTARANEGQLSIMIGGDAATVARAQPVLETFADKLFHVGDTGAGATIKLVTNLLTGINMASTMEALVLGVKAGLSVEMMQKVISASTGKSWAFETFSDLLMTRSPEPPPGETASMGLHTIVKDVRLAARLADDLSVPLPIGSSAVQLFFAGLGQGWTDKENWIMMELFEQISGVRVRPPEL